MYVCISQSLSGTLSFPLDEMEVIAMDFNHSIPLLDNITVLCCTVAPPPGIHGDYDDSECVVMVTD